MTGRAVDLDGVTVTRDGVAVLHRVNLHVDFGEVLALRGAPLAGKTSVLLTVAGHLNPDAGAVTVSGPVAWLAPGVPLARPTGVDAPVPFRVDDAVPHVVLCDEPTLGLPASVAGAMRAAVRSLAAAGHAVIVASGDPAVHALGDVAVLVDRGRTWLR